MNAYITQLIELALAEDIAKGDITSQYFIPQDTQAHAYVLVKQSGVVAGQKVAKEVCSLVDETISFKPLVKDGAYVSANTRVIEIFGNAQSILSAERVMLNFMQRLSGVATNTKHFVDKVRHTGVKVLDTRKTTPGWRLLEKEAVVAGGGVNHRMGLYDRAMLKDNHLVAQRDINALQQAIIKLKEDCPQVPVQLECDTLDQVKSFLTLQFVDYILLDNMSCEQLKIAVSMRNEAKSSVLLEASGGVSLDTVGQIAQSGVDFISVGALTHSAVALDISLEFVPV